MESAPEAVTRGVVRLQQGYITSKTKDLNCAIIIYTLKFYLEESA
jgi:hypothetical protein